MPREVHGLVRAVNGLMDRVQEGLEREHRFIADAAHELRTPIAALKVHAANLRLAANARERDESQQQLDASVLRIERMVAQLLALSRVEAVAALPRRNVNLDTLVRSESEDVLAIALQRQQTLELVLVLQPVQVIADETALSPMLRNLLENAVRYTPLGGRILVRTHSAPMPTLVVEDSGPGIPEAARARSIASIANWARVWRAAGWVCRSCTTMNRPPWAACASACNLPVTRLANKRSVGRDR